MLNVLIGSSQLTSEDTAPIVVVEADPDRFDAVRESKLVSPSLRETSVHQAVLAASSGQEISWYTYNDSRFNGVVTLDRWQVFFPNLFLQHEEKLTSHTLAEILDQCLLLADDHQRINLTITQGDPLEVLKGASLWLHRFHRIQLQGPKIDLLWSETLEPWLEDQGFMRDDELPATWVLDDQKLSLIKKTQEAASLTQELLASRQILQTELDQNRESSGKLLEAIISIFPYSAYRAKRPDLFNLTDRELVTHFVNHGREEGTNLNHEDLKLEWAVSAVGVSLSGRESPAFDAKTSPSPASLDILTMESMSVGPSQPDWDFRPLAETRIQSWLVDSQLFVSLPAETIGDFPPAVYKGQEGFSLNRIQWDQEILDRLQGRPAQRLLCLPHQHFIKALSENRDSHILDSGINQLPGYFIPGGETLHVHLSTTEENFEVSLIDDFKLECDRQEIWSLDCLLACHRAQGCLFITTTHHGKSHVQSVLFDGRKVGRSERAGYQAVKVDLHLEKGISHLSIRIKHARITATPDDLFDCYYFLANPTLRYCGKPGQKDHGLLPRSLGCEREIDVSALLFSSTILPFSSPSDPSLVLRLGNRICVELFTPGQELVKLTADHSHCLEMEASPEGDFALYINGSFCQLVSIGSDPTPVPLPLQWLRGEQVQVDLRDASGSQVHLTHHVLAPRFHTPSGARSHQVKSPYPANLSLREHQRYQSFCHHLDLPIEGLRTEMLKQALHTLESEDQQLKLSPLEFPYFSDPEVSIIIPVLNHFRITYAALCALLLAHNRVRFEVVLIDDGSVDETRDIENWVTGLRAIHHEKSLGFIQSCNRGVTEARGKYVVLLNNDTEVTVGWLDALVDGFQRFDHVGLVGSKLLNPDGSLQDAGGIVWGSGNPWNYGYGQNPWEPRFCYARQVDYLSGAACMTTKSIWEQVGGLSSYLEPMYFEDTDFSFKVRAAGYTTYFIPSSIVYHYQGLTSGVNPSDGFKIYQDVNRPKFKRVWAKAFASHGMEGEQPDLEKDRGIKGRILFIDHSTPREDQDAGSYAAIREIELVQSLGYKITFLPQDLCYYPGYTDELLRNGVEVITWPFYLSVADFIVRRVAEFDAVYITRYVVAAGAVPLIREHAPKTKILLNNADLYFLRELRSALVNKDEQKMAAMRSTRDQELQVMRKVDVVLSYNEVEHAVIASHTDGEVKVMKSPWVVTVPETIAPLAERHGLCFLANFDHWPNLEGIQWFCQDVMPALAERRLKLFIYGSNFRDEIRELANEWIDPMGYIENIGQAYQKHRVFVAPLLSGAGIKGKVVNALAYGLPTVLTPVAAEGLGLRHGSDCLLARTSDEWVTAIMSLYDQDDRWLALSTASRAYAASHFSFSEGRQRMQEALEAVDLYNHMES
ncbi:MAG: glycosyltransferase [Cyanobacteriota bacterium]|nr:glycosyltransferase [Cyanobacteriota bacterium]